MKHLIDEIFGFAKDCIEKFAALQGVDRALALSAQAFSALFPVLILVAAIEPSGSSRDIASTLVERFGLEGAGEKAVRQAFATPDAVTGSITVISIFLVVFSALAFARGLQRLYESAWGLSRRGIKSTGWGLGWLVMISLYWAIVSAYGGNGRPVIGIGLAFLLWLATPYVLLERRISWKRLIPQALLTAISIAAVGIWSTIYMPQAISSSAQQFGVVGVSFALLTWLVALSFAIVIATSIGTAGYERWGDRDEGPDSET